MKSSIKVKLALFISQLLLGLVVFAQPAPPGGGGGGSSTNEPYNWTALPYVPGLKLGISLVDRTNFQLTLLEADPAGQYDIYSATNIVPDSWSDILQGVTGQTNFILPIPASQNGFFRVTRTDQAVVDAAGISFYFISGFVNTNITLAAVEGGPAVATAILVDSTNFTGATWIPFSSMPLVDIGTNEGTHEIWLGFRGTNGVVYWTSDTVILDKTPPAIVITNPVLSTTSRPIIQIQGYSTEPLSSINFDVTNAAGSITNQQGFVTAQSFDTNGFNSTTNWFQCFDVELTNGMNTITVHAADLAGNITTTNVTVTLDYTDDTNPPVISITWPQDGAQISGTNFTLRGVLDDETAQITAQTVDTNGFTNIISGEVERNGTFWLDDLPMNSGTNIIMIAATDMAGNTSATNFTLVQSGVALTINPVSDDQLNLSETAVTGTVSDPSYDVWVNSVQAAVDGSGNWTVSNVPVYGNGTATFDVIAYPPGQSPNLLTRMNSNSGQSPAQISQVREQPTKVYISEFHDNWGEDEGDYGHWANTKGYNAQVDNSGHFSYKGQATSSGDLDPSLDWWWKLMYNWSDVDPGGTATETENEEGSIETANSPGCNPLTSYWYIPDCNSVPSSSPPGIVHYYANINYAWSQWFGIHKYYRTSNTYLKLRTGGRSGIERKSLFRLNACATRYGKPTVIDWGNGPDDWYGTPANGIDSTRIRVLGRNIGNDGNLFIVLPENATLDLGATAPGRHYSLGVGATKHKLFIQANGHILQSDRVVSLAKFCVGQKINLGSFMNPSIDEYVRNINAEWSPQSVFVNYIENWPFSAKKYLIDWSLLDQKDTYAWWVTGGEKKLRCDWNLTFNNGQTAKVYALGRMNMHRPQVMNFTDMPPHYAWINTNKLHFGRPWLQLGEDNGNATGDMGFHCDIKSDFSGQANWTQLIDGYRNRDETYPLGSYTWSTGGQYWLDGSKWGFAKELYLDQSIQVNPPPLYTEPLPFGDQPGWPVGLTVCTINDQFKTYVRFRPSGNDSIWVTLGRVDWSWSATAALGGQWGITSQFVPTPQLHDDIDFPFWLNFVSSFDF